jgi:hypothetical protein
VQLTKLGQPLGRRTGDSIFESPVIAGERWYAARESNPNPLVEGLLIIGTLRCAPVLVRSSAAKT